MSAFSRAWSILPVFLGTIGAGVKVFFSAQSYHAERMSVTKLAVVAVLALVVIAWYMSMHRKSPRDVAIDKAVKRIFGIKGRHHDKIVDALEGGASEEQHIAMLEEKRRDVLQAMEQAESKYDIVIDKTNPTEPGPVVVLQR